MDQRQVFNNDNDLLSFVITIAREKTKASLLIDKDGITRVEGIITTINRPNEISNAIVVINNSDNVLLRDIIGINGIFRSDYCEC